jgi:uncharacterized membrane protein YeiB
MIGKLLPVIQTCITQTTQYAPSNRKTLKMKLTLLSKLRCGALLGWKSLSCWLTLFIIVYFQFYLYKMAIYEEFSFLMTVAILIIVILINWRQIRCACVVLNYAISSLNCFMFCLALVASA